MSHDFNERVLSLDFYKNRNSQFIGLGDEFEIRPFMGRRQTISLNRTHMKIFSFNGTSIKKEDAQIYVPALVDQSWSLSLSLCRTQKGIHDHEKSVYLLKTETSNPFNFNGSQVFEALISQNDQIKIGPTSFIFRSGISKETPSFDRNTQQIFENKKIINSDRSILIEGETGTGKTFLAKKIFTESNLPGSFIHLNISSYSSGLIESELFGHVKGAFTGAINDKRGALSAADSGILFLDEIDSLSLEMQTKLLIFLDTKEYRPVGSEILKKSNAKIIFASGRSLKELTDSGKMRRDFYFRLHSGFKIPLQSLRQNPDLIKNYIEKFCEDQCVGISQEALEFYLQQEWPGNIRQLLSHLDKKKMTMKGPRIQLDENDSELINEGKMIDTNNTKIRSLQEIKEQYAFDIYLKLNRQIYETSHVLDISPNTLKRLISKNIMQ